MVRVLGSAWQAHKEEKAFLFQLLDKVLRAHASVHVCVRASVRVGECTVCLCARVRVCASLSARVWSACACVRVCVHVCACSHVRTCVCVRAFTRACQDGSNSLSLPEFLELIEVCTGPCSFAESACVQTCPCMNARACLRVLATRAQTFACCDACVRACVLARVLACALHHRPSGSSRLR